VVDIKKITLILGFRNDFGIHAGSGTKNNKNKHMKILLIYLMVPASMAVFCTLYWIVEKRMNTWRRKTAQRIILRKYAL
jgi:flagellar basal body-associated protein FliL